MEKFDLAKMLGPTISPTGVATSLLEYLQRLSSLELNHFGAWPLSSGHCDLRQVPEIIADAINIALQSEGFSPYSKIEFRKWYADLKPEGAPVITWRVIKSAPGMFSKGSIRDTNSPSVREQTFHLRSVIDDPDSPGMQVLTYARVLDSILELCVWAGDADQAEDVTEWFINFMEKYKWYFHMRGVHRVLFDTREEDKYLTAGSMYGSPLIYFIRTEQNMQIKEATLRSLALKITLKEQK